MTAVPKGDFNPSDEQALDVLVGAAAKRFRDRLRNLGAQDRADAMQEAQDAALAAALAYGTTPEKTTKWKRAANAAGYALRQFFEARHLQPLAESDLADDEDGGDRDVLTRMGGGSSVFERDDDDERYWGDDDDERDWGDDGPPGSYQTIDQLQEDMARSALRKQLDDRANRIVDMDESGSSAPQIASEVGMKPAAVRKFLSRFRMQVGEAARGSPSALPPDPDAFEKAAPLGEIEAGTEELGRLPRSFDPD